MDENEELARLQASNRAKGTFSKNPVVLNKGLFTDNNEEFQPPGTYKFALNSMLTTSSGEKGALTNEEGNQTCIDLEDSSAHVIGNCLLDNGEVVLFVSYDAYGIYPAHGAILIQREDCTASYLVRSECLNFLPTDVIKCEYKIQNGCDTILYFTDRRSKYKYLNISKLEQYVLLNRTLADANTPILGEFGWDCGLFNFNPDFNIPQIQLTQILFGGKLRVGAYFIALRYFDGSLNGTNWTGASGPIYITAGSNQFDPMSISGGILNPSTLEDGFYYSPKSIQLKISNLDLRYKYFQLAILEFSQGTTTNNATYVSKYYNISQDESVVSITELSASTGFTTTSNATINIPTEYIDVVRAHTQVDRRLIVGNLSKNVNDWSVFQKAANDIKSLYYTYEGTSNQEIGDCETLTINQFEASGSKGLEFNKPEFLFDNKTYMRDEIYAFAIVYVFKNGEASPAFHIPGRPAISNVAGTDLNGKYSVTEYDSNFETFNNDVGRARWYLSYNDSWAYGSAVNGYYDNYNAPLNGSWDRELYSYEEDKIKTIIPYDSYDGFNSDTDSTGVDDYTMANTFVDKSQNIFSNGFCSSQSEMERWEFVNTSIKFNTEKPDDAYDPTYNYFNALQDIAADNLYSAGLCGYYEADAQYPPVRDCNGDPIFPHTIVDGEVVMHRIRHHKMPDARHERLYEGLGDDGSNVLLSLKPLGMFFYDISIPVGYENDIQGYYIVRGDRSGNKTVIDKGWLNVCDVTFGMQLNEAETEYSTVELNGEPILGIPFNPPFSVQQNPIWMVPTDKYGSWEPLRTLTDPNELNGRKQMHRTGSNYIEFFSPKSSYNEVVNLQGNYYKLENTVITTPPRLQDIRRYTGTNTQDDDWNGVECETPSAWEGKASWRVYGYVEAYNLTLPRMFTFKRYGDFTLLHNVPIIYNEYALYNQDDFASNGFTINNDNHRQTIMLSKLYNDLIGVSADEVYKLNIASMFKPIPYTLATESVAPIAGERSDILNPTNDIDGPTVRPSFDLSILTDNFVDGIKEINAFNDDAAAHFYYSAIKSSIKPYQKLEEITYIKSSNNMISFPEVGLSNTFETGGDCFISKQRMFKSFVRGTATNVEDNSTTNGKLAGTVVVGYVESEINSHFRNKFNDDAYYANPFDSWPNCLSKATEDVHAGDTTLIDFIEHLYRYNLDFSTDNRNRRYFPLTDVYNYCSDCSEKFKHTIRYSEPSISTQTNDFYKEFLANSVQEIPTNTGEITNLFVKEQNLFVHTISNLYRLNLAPQELETGNDRIQVGSGTIANSVPQRLLDNANGYGRGGTEFEHSGVFCNDAYIWVDNKSKRVYSLSKGLEELSAQGMNMWFRNNLNLILREQWKSITQTDYPYLNTSDRKSIGFISGFDPYYDRYILHKKDYELLPEIVDSILLDPGPGFYTVGNYYWNNTGIYIARSEELLEELNLENNEFVKNKSFTISYSLEFKVWASFHSYRPNHIWNNNLTFFSSINNIQYSDYAWKHNVRNYQNYYDNKFDFIYEYVALGEEPVLTKAYDNIEIMGNVYNYNTTTNSWKEVFYSAFDRVHVYNNTQSSGLFEVQIKNEDPYFDIYNDSVNTRVLSIKRNRDIWRIHNLRDYTKEAGITDDETILSNDWNLLDYSSYFTTNENMGFIDYGINPDYIDVDKSVYELQRFRDKFLNVRLFFKPEEDYKIVINTMANLKRTLV